MSVFLIKNNNRFFINLRWVFFLFIFVMIISSWLIYAEEAAANPYREYLSPGNSSPPYQPIIPEELEAIVITAKRVVSNKKYTAENVIVYTEEDIRQTSAQDLGEFLKSVPSVDVQLNGQLGQATSLSINGSNARQVLLMVDGIPFNTQLSGQANPTQIPIGHISRIEIIKGSASSAWGSGLGGVINVITKDTGDSVKPKGSLTSSFAEFGTLKERLSLSGKINDVSYFLAGSYQTTDGAQAISDAESKIFFSKLKFQLSEEINVVSSFGYSRADAQYALLTSSTVVSQPHDSRYGQIQLNVDEIDYQWHAAVKYNHQDITTNITSVSTGELVSSTVSSNVYKGISLNGSFDMFDYGELVVGADFDWYTLKSNRYLDRSKSISMQAPYANHTLSFGNWELINGIRFDNNDQFGSQISPSMGTVYHFDDQNDTALRVKVSRGFNAPPLLWLFNDDASLFVGPNPDLRAEKSIFYEAGLESKIAQSVDLDVNIYRADVKDGIALVFDSVDNVYVQENFRSFLRQGGEVVINYQVTDVVAIYGSGGFNDVKNKETGRLVRDFGIARQKFTLGINYKNLDGLSIHLYGYYNRWSSSPSQQPNDRKPIFDLRLSKEFLFLDRDLDIETFLNVYNLMNSSYWSNRSFPMPQRYFEGGFTVKF